MARMTQTEIVSHMADKTGLTKAQTKEFFNTFSALAMKETKKSGEFSVPGLGKLVKTRRKARTGRNPATGAPLKIPAKTTVKFRVGKAMKDSVA
ncbi:MAG: HU family DNA-binding protein [Pyrinomonadaceae bacterium]|nr:HU family DNA-binding protein [Pyrinomonadaceae bacterium]